ISRSVSYAWASFRTTPAPPTRPNSSPRPSCSRNSRAERGTDILIGNAHAFRPVAALDRRAGSRPRILRRTDFSAGKMAQSFLLRGRTPEWGSSGLLVPWFRRTRGRRRPHTRRALEPLHRQMDRALFDGRHARLSRDQSRPVPRFAPAPLLPVAL